MARWLLAVMVLLAAAPAAAAEGLFLEVTGSPALRVKGSCRLIDDGGAAREASFDGTVPHRYRLEAAAASCRVSMMDERGYLRASLVADDREIVAIETNALYGSVSVRSDGPWGAARATRTGALYRRQIPAQPDMGTGRTPTVPPLKGTTVPPLRGTTVPQPR